MMSAMTTGNIALLAVFAVLLLAGAPISVSLGLAGAAAVIVGLDFSTVAMVGTNTYASIAKYPLIAIPLFVLTGVVFERSGVATRLVTFAQAIVGPRRGGLALVAVLVCLIMGGMSGSGPAEAATVATVMIPSMTRAGYPPAFSAGIIAASASTAILIPPSLALIVYSILAPGTDLRALFAAGIVPGMIAGLSIIVPAVWLSRRHGFGDAGPEGAPGPPFRPAFWPAFRGALPGLLAPVIILGGLRSGYFTPTEAAAVAAAYGFAVGALLYRSMSLGDVWNALADAAETSAAIMIVIALAGLFAWAGSTLGAFDAAAAGVLSVSDDGMVVLVLVMIVLLVAGMLLDGVSIYLITLPLLIPIATAFEWNLVWFGVLMAMNVAIGQFTPPMAINLLVTARVAEVPIEHTIRWMAWFIVSMGLAMGLVIAFPSLALWLPELLGYRT